MLDLDGAPLDPVLKCKLKPHVIIETSPHRWQALWLVEKNFPLDHWPDYHYEAKVMSFGCTSIEEVHRLQSIRSDQKAFQMALLEKQIYGECVTILKGTVVEGSIETNDKSVLRVNGQVEPPGYEAPRHDFEIKAAEGRH